MSLAELKSAIIQAAKSISKVNSIIPELTQEELAEAIQTAYSEIVHEPLEADCIERIREVAVALTSQKKNFIYMKGGVGTGKSTMVRAIMLVIDSLRRNLYLKIVKASDVRTENLELLSKYQGAVAVDDFGIEPLIEKVWGTERMPLVELIYKRYDENLPLIISTNLLAEQVKERYGARIADRLNERAIIINFLNKSYRRKV